MLILTRFKDESIIINTSDGCVEVTIEHVGQDGKVRLGIEAPKSIAVHRKEIQLRIDKEKGTTNGVVPNMPGKTH